MKREKIKLAKEITLFIHEEPSKYGIVSVAYSLGIASKRPWQDEMRRAERIDFYGQYNKTDSDGNEVNDRKVYAIRTDASFYLRGSFHADDITDLKLELLKRFQQWQDKNEALTSRIECQETIFLAFLEASFKVRRLYNRETFNEATWPNYAQ